MKLTRQIAVASLIISILMGSGSIYYASLSFQNSLANTRANLSILGSHVKWQLTNESCVFELSGQIRNQGARAADIKSINLSITYPLKNGGTVNLVYDQPLVYVNWQNYTLTEKESREFDVEEIVYFNEIPQNFQVAQNPTEGSIRITFYDGMSTQEMLETFPFVQGS